MSTPKTPAWQFPPRTVLVAVDFGEASAKAVALAGAIATAFGAQLRAVHAERFEPPPYFTLEQIARLEDERRQSAAAAAGHLGRFVAQATPFPAQAEIVDAPPVDAILQAAATADLIVVGTHGRRGPGRWWLGSVAERVVRSAVAPVLVTRADVPAGEFDRVVLLGDGAEPSAGARRVAQGLADAFKGLVVAGGPVAGCRPEATANATLVVIALAAGHPAWSLTDSVAKILGGCDRPVLFVPALDDQVAKQGD